jgi:hypothetical protein
VLKMEVINSLRIKFKKRRSKFSTKLRDIPETGVFKSTQAFVSESLGDLSEDELFLVPVEVLDMDSSRVREDLSSMARTKHSYLGTIRPEQSLTLLQDRSGIFMARASQGCSTLWICEY